MLNVRLSFIYACLRRVVFFTGVLFVVACSEDCVTDGDCAGGNLCVAGSCKPLEAALNSDTADIGEHVGNDSSIEVETDTDSSNQTAQIAQTDTQSQAQEKADTDIVSAISPDTGQESMPAANGAADGESCTEGSECQSQNCSNGVCCDEGECCPTPGEAQLCGGGACQATFCDGNFMCQVYNLPAGAMDFNSKSPCVENNRCDGQGTCVSVVLCDSTAYNGTGVFQSIGGALTETCFDSCMNNSQCRSGYACKEGVCTDDALMENGEWGCYQNSDCASMYCDWITHVCCDGNRCCVSDDVCGWYTCDTDTSTCVTTCRNSDGVDDDSLCSSAGNYHCDGGWCYFDLVNGMRWCDEHSDCLSGVCDLTSGMCTAGTTACDSDERCGGMKCLQDMGHYCADSCMSEGVEDDTLCADGYRCDSGNCVAELLEDGEACENDEECAAGHCENGFCCAKGECCNSQEDCESEGKCTVPTCTGSKECIYYPLPCGTYDLFSEEACNGEYRCDGVGNCVKTSPCEGGYIGSDYTCSEGSVAEVCDYVCMTDDDCQDEYHCVDSECVEDIYTGGEGCDSNGDCESGNCNPITGVCCNSGYCCNHSSHCADFILQCDFSSYSCLLQCEEDSDCSLLGDFHCIEGVCEQDIPNGEGYCFSDHECSSEHCDEEVGLCCNQGECCLDDGECGGFICTDDYSCVSNCVDNDALCSEGNFCNQDLCEPKKPNGASCEEDGDCISENCDEATAVCCDTGMDCCQENDDCDDGNPCTEGYCSAAFTCTFIEKSDGESCSNGSFCDGEETCQGGECQATGNPCPESDACNLSTCDEEEDTCTKTPRNIGGACSEPLFCLGNVAKTCSETGLCTDPKTGTPPCAQDPSSPCMEQYCDEALNKCSEMPAQDGTICDTDPCNGTSVCVEGACVSSDLPCDDGDPCTTDECELVEGVPTCGAITPKADGDLCDNPGCLGEDAACHQGECIPADIPPCGDGSICTVDTCYLIANQSECESGTNEATTIACGQTYQLTGDAFSTREYRSYGESCPGDFVGMEAPLSLSVQAEGNVTVSIVAAEPSVELSLFLLSDVCSSSTCQSVGVNALSFSAMVGEYAIVVDSTVATPPETFLLEVACQ